MTPTTRGNSNHFLEFKHFHGNQTFYYLSCDYRPSEYLDMGTMSVGSDTAPAEGYLFMNNSRPTSANSFNQTDSGQFDFQFSPKLRKVDEETMNSVEMRPMLIQPPHSPDQLVNGFSNPNYQNPPPIKCSDLDDLPQTVMTTKSPSIATTNAYINIIQPPTKDEEAHYVSPKNNSRLV